MKLMIVDDSNIIRKMIENTVRSLGLEIAAVAGNGEEAVELFKRTLPDIVTMDITMPKLDGIGCLKQIMNIKPETRVVMCTALKDHETGLAALKAGAFGFVSKPFTAVQLTEELTAAMNDIAG
ncbi:response regulator [Treponema brennaborense]|uniref:Response regulator receiver protein n=1 Tax=Treponema brennaborense (strain DSM 12168 / CIP 105900 / DD5/3) TaxID=906968 RepID=F4LLV3_TREBD|nr:response regulator [Treponema brennaborense]AEE15645.1 response regulator receiver protein [Treponema brennaborense DSM 12168]